MFEAGSRREVFFEPEEWERFLGAFEDDRAWKSYRVRLRNLGPVKEGLKRRTGCASAARRKNRGRRKPRLNPLNRVVAHTRIELMSRRRGAPRRSRAQDQPP